MKLLLDWNISRRIVSELQGVYPGSSQVALLGLASTSDSAIWRFARKNDFVIVTKDADFAEISLIWGSPSRVIWIRLGNVGNKNILSTLLENRSRISALFEQNAVDCIEIHGAA
uniref:Predicted nuclease, contains PIN domain, potential toxin-antitoxin system component n=1 Tax=Candidatus Kentrum sp. MB TaxID=2138164 RepID=A0A450XCI0_9GAMM|nr:MAG: Predicted nuclease, contains PIN domain, potential toxin-antitoxin system component [Candidatus Kentron sp. MB]VFK31218.1 MAG: Predicted nuclease, contains PIN domain, potential toxin-antitoxin system component [Candidatus Kentron sp. MB]VFK75396.1 MAG: Predicted nuclease, contains PIN domain, potential toxin-antitoxin system component [Candidatus Kentron sp. MB]